VGLRDQLNRALTRRVRLKSARSRLSAPVASFSFDDFPRSAWTVGGPILARYRARATYYVAGRFCGAHEDGLDYYERDDLRAVHAAGHEVGCHTFSHRPSPEVPSAEWIADLERNAAFVRETLGEVRMTTFAYPYGEASPRTKVLAGRRYTASRGIYPGVNGPMLDLGQLRAVPLEVRNWSAEWIEREVASAAGAGGWLVFFSHDVSDSPSPYGATPEILEHALACVTRAGVEVLPVKDACDRALSA
jgi:peptidoglycan/xylan/chitin deacetylase (PgdA/CDA1 family)